jgi:hypothetical protein
MECRTARSTFMIERIKKRVFEELCDQEDFTPSQKIRQFIQEYIEQHLGLDWRDQVLLSDKDQ